MMHGPERAIRPYSRSEANAQRVLSNLKDGFYCAEGLILCIQLSVAELLVLTEEKWTSFKWTLKKVLLL